ncbi:MAG: hypothetical protein IBJ03_15920 [Gemmatimonadaceae bacterium]|nr:hypothetical protein [Gemmatimonadaceae bacterium]
MLWIALALVAVSLCGNVVIYIYIRLANRMKPPAIAGAISGSLAVLLLLLMMLYGTERLGGMVLYLASVVFLLASNALLYFGMRNHGRKDNSR